MVESVTSIKYFLNKKYFVMLFVIILLIVTYATLPNIDYVKTDVLFYFTQLPPLYHISVIITAITAILSNDRNTRILCLIAFSFLVMCTPNLLMYNPWHFDPYAFVAEAVYIQRYGHIDNVWYLSECPALGLFFGSLLLMTNIDPFFLIKAYQSFITVAIVLITYLIADQVNANKKNLIIAPLCLISLMWPNVFIFNRQSFSLIFYLTSWLLLLKLLLKKIDYRILGFLFIQILLMIISHPATPIFFLFNLVGIMVVGLIFRLLQLKEIRLLAYSSWFTAIMWLLWNSMGSSQRSLEIITDMIDTFLRSLMNSPGEISGVMKLLGYTPVYGTIINIRLLLTLAPAVCSLFFPILIYWRNKKSQTAKIALILMAWALSNFSSALPLLYSGLPYFERPVLFSFLSWGPLAGFTYEYLKTSNAKIMKIAKTTFIIAFILIPALLLPIIKLSPLPFMYPTTNEIHIDRFITIYYEINRPIIFMEYTRIYAYTFITNIHYINESYIPILLGDVQYESQEELADILKKSSLALTYRILTRDAFRIYDPTMSQLIYNITNVYPEMSYNKVYDSGWPYSVQIPRG